MFLILLEQRLLSPNFNIRKNRKNILTKANKINEISCMKSSKLPNRKIPGMEILYRKPLPITRSP